ncbi:MAG TPA: Crp/Fnr family transcriptional regulator [Syntrophales bacterium]|nr:Crp/Fnr family transcriptional regulator [Syntrophales bacterium]HOM07902.1 Crp/Fnr family transcriptional regulator [Syntrophales bacterium]HOO00556.1 Crp/Fnr family transcriptional regulator [Syntrophales bacterium]HPC02021.1 Crp/Fnr family transcriptional regulator [Syntrophales bacterium]
MKKKRDALAASRLFGGLAAEDLEQLEEIAVERHFLKGETVFLEGDEGRGFYLVAEGAVSVYKVSAEGKEQILRILREGETVGAVPVFLGGSFPANARALAKSRLLFFDRRDFIRLIGGKPNLALNLLAVLAARLREFTIQVENLALKEIPARLASYLVTLAEEQDNEDLVRLTISKAQIAGLLGATPESLSRALGAMKAKGLIREEGDAVRLLDLPRLRALALGGHDA